MHELTSEDLAFASNLAERHARPYRTSPFHEDLVSAALEATVRAARRFDESSGVPFRVYLRTRIPGAVIDEWRHITHTKGPAHGNKAPISIDGDAFDAASELSVPDGVDELLSTIDAVSIVRTSVASGQRRRIVLEHVLRDRPQREIGSDLGVSQTCVCQQNARAIEEMRTALVG